MPGYDNLSSITGHALTAKEALAFIIMTEFGTSIGFYQVNSNEALTRRYHGYCSDNYLSGRCHNSFWAYMEGWRNSASISYARTKMREVLDHPNYQTALDLAEVVLNPDKPNSFGINANMKNLNGPSEWVTIKPGQGNYYSHVQQMYNQQLANQAPGATPQPIGVAWIWPDSRGNYFMTMTFDQVKSQCNPSNPTYCNLTSKTTWP